MMTIYIVDLEAIPTRYTCEWKTHLPAMLELHGAEVVVLSGPNNLPDDPTPGMFLNFSATNIYKATQVEKFSRLFSLKIVKDGDYFLFTDAWHPGVINLRYMADLLGIKIKIGGLWHAGSYDKHDGLGQRIGEAPWVRHAEKSFFHAFDHNYFATNFHIDMFCQELLNDGTQENPWAYEDKKDYLSTSKIVRTGWPMEYMPATLAKYAGVKKENIIIYPHRISAEKQPDIFLDLKASLPEYEFIVCQDKKLSKTEYHELLAKSKLMFSANLQETLGISPFEGALLNVMPMVPDRLSYAEMYTSEYKYPSKWTVNFDSYLQHKDKIIARIRSVMEQPCADTSKLSAHLLKEYFTASTLMTHLF
jgi:glycosyltransferase involved in cell wall biosynthesis